VLAVQAQELLCLLSLFQPLLMVINLYLHQKQRDAQIALVQER
jgi:hypothetical protein